MAEEITIIIEQTVEQVNVEVAEFTIPGLISSDANNALELGSDEKLFVSVNSGGESNLSLSKTKTTNVVANDNGTGFTLGLGNGTEAGISENNFTDAEKTKLSNVPTNTNTALSLKLDASAYNDRFKGKFTTLLALQTAYPTASAGDYAQVDAGSGSNVKNYNYDLEEGWVEGSSTPSASNTDELPEGSTNLYFTTARVLATILTGISFVTGGSIVATDSILIAFGKLQNQITNLLSNNLGTYLFGLTPKTTPVDADTITINDTEDSNVLKKVSLTNLWENYIKSKADVLYSKPLYDHTYTWQVSSSAITLLGSVTPTHEGASFGYVLPNFTGTYLSSPYTTWARRYVDSATTAGSSASVYEAARRVCAVGLGFNATTKVGFGIISANSRFFFGLIDTLSAFGNVNPTTKLNLIGFGKDAGDTNIQLIHNDNSGVATKIDLGVDFATANLQAFKINLSNVKGSSSVDVQIDLINTNKTYKTTITTDLPSITKGLAPHLFINNGTDASLVGLVYSYFNIVHNE